MNITRIKSEADYDRVLAVIDSLMGAAPDTSRRNHSRQHQRTRPDGN